MKVLYREGLAIHSDPGAPPCSSCMRQCAGLTRRTSFAIIYVMNTKLTLRMDEDLVRRAKAEASRRGKSVSQMVSEFVDSLGSPRQDEHKLPPITASLVGVLKDHRISEADYKRHLREKHL